MCPLNQCASSNTHATGTIRILRLISASGLSESQSIGAANVSPGLWTSNLRLCTG
ncbi:hypothetical protein RISK_000098 [Rhodopirellula islandica]|uniref:Uncharacterized protein n=1 Tax=Rhodopirellula islandica TaxID=595434 RepID=A0A0J1ER20_RHOIS|nr:hypothetical protein RISK_000098 [Rhodopirellula islandica]